MYTVSDYMRIAIGILKNKCNIEIDGFVDLVLETSRLNRVLTEEK